LKKKPVDYDDLDYKIGQKTKGRNRRKLIFTREVIGGTYS